MYKWSCPEGNCNWSYIGKSSRCLENRIKEPNIQVTSAISQHSASNNHPKANISHFKIMHNSKQVAREAIHIRINNSTVNYNTGKMYVPEIFQQYSWSRWIYQQLWPNGRLRLPARSHSSYGSKQEGCKRSVWQINPYDAQLYFQYGPIFAKFQFNSSQLQCLPLPAFNLTELTTYQTM